MPAASIRLVGASNAARAFDRTPRDGDSSPIGALIVYLVLFEPDAGRRALWLDGGEKPPP
jgi:hypothetical protein